MVSGILQSLSQAFDYLVEYALLLTELIGVGVLMWSVLKALYTLFHHGKQLRLELAEGIALSLEFKMGGELLRTLIVREWTELLILGAIVALRVAMTLLIHWEIHLEKKNAAPAKPAPTPCNHKNASRGSRKRTR